MTLHHPTPSIRVRIERMASRWQYSDDELQAALADAQRNPVSFLTWLERDELATGVGTISTWRIK